MLHDEVCAGYGLAITNMDRGVQHDLDFPKDFPLIPSQYARVMEMLKSRLDQAMVVRLLMCCVLWQMCVANPDGFAQCLATVRLTPAVLVVGMKLVSVVVTARIAPDGPSTAQRPYALLTLLCEHLGDVYILMVKWAELAEVATMPAPARFVRRLLPVVHTCASGSVFCATYFGPPSAFWVALRCSLAFNAGIFRGSCTLFLQWAEAPAFYPPFRLSFAGAMSFSLSFVLIAAAATSDLRHAFAKRFPLSMSIQLSELQGLTEPRLDSHGSLDSCSVPRNWFRRIESSASSATLTERSGLLPDHPSNGRSVIPWIARLPWRWERERERQRKSLERRFLPSKMIRRPVSVGSSSWSISEDSEYSTLSQHVREAHEVGGLTDGRSCAPRKLKPS